MSSSDSKCMSPSPVTTCDDQMRCGVGSRTGCSDGNAVGTKQLITLGLHALGMRHNCAEISMIVCQVLCCLVFVNGTLTRSNKNNTAARQSAPHHTFHQTAAVYCTAFATTIVWFGYDEAISPARNASKAIRGPAMRHLPHQKARIHQPSRQGRAAAASIRVRSDQRAAACHRRPRLARRQGSCP